MLEDNNPEGARLAIGRDVTEAHQMTSLLGNRVARLEAMHAVSRGIAAGEPGDTLLADALDRLSELVPLRHRALYVLEGDALAPLTGWDSHGVRTGPERVAVAAHPAAEAVHALRPVAFATTGAEAVRWPTLRTLDRMGSRAALAVPLTEGDHALGVLWLATGRATGFSPEDTGAAEELAGLLAHALVQRRLTAELAAAARALEERVAERTTALRTAQARLIDAARLTSIGEMAAGIAHELHQPLNAFMGYIDLLQEGSLDAAGSARALRVMAGAAERMGTVVEHLRDFSRAGVETLRPVDLRGVLDVARDLTARATGRPVAVVWSPPDEPVLVVGDPSRLEQLFINLIANGLHATEDAGGDRVSVRLHPAGDAVIVEVEDQGPGVPASLREQIFQPFFTTKERGRGTGLGLSISSKIAAEHAGRIAVDDGPGGGAVFRVTLPRHRES